MRIILNILAVVAGLLSLLMGLQGGALLLPMFTLLSDPGSGFPSLSWFTLSLIAAAAAGLIFLGVFIVIRCYNHLRQPDRKSALTVVRWATFMVTQQVMGLVWLSPLVSRPDGEKNAVIGLVASLGMIIVAYLIYWFVLKPVAARAFPPEALGQAS